MKTTHFEYLFQPGEFQDQLQSVLKIRFPQLPAYAIEYAEFIPPINLEFGYQPSIQNINFEIVDDHVLWRGHSIFGVSTAVSGLFRLVIHYHGIRDYSALFPFIKNMPLRKRLGEFYSDAERTFESEAWLPFAVMCGAIYEGILAGHPMLKAKKFGSRIEEAKKKSLLNETEAEILNLARESRNLVHAERADSDPVSRTNAMDIRTTLDTVIRAFSNKFEQGTSE